MIAAARKAAGISQKDLAASILKEDGSPISAQYLNDVEHGRRNPPSEKIIEQLAKKLKLSKEQLMAAAGLMPSDLSERLAKMSKTEAEVAFRAFRKELK